MSQRPRAFRLPFPRFSRGPLGLWLTVTVVVTVLVVVGIGALADYRREYRVHFEGVFASLEEQAQALKVARRQMMEAPVFAQYVDEFCAQMNEFVSPGHHILVLGPHGSVLVRSRHHSGVEVERALLAAGASQRVVEIEDHRIAQARLRDADGSTIVVAQYLDHMEAIVRSQLISRAATAAVTAVALILLLSLAVHVWVHKPLSRLTRAGRAWAGGDFVARAEASGPADLRQVVSEFNVMASRLEEHEEARSAELEQARQIQTSLLPGTVPRVPDLAFAAAYRPAEHVAGDLYDLFALPDGTFAVAILDVAGHGISAALITGVVKMALHWRLPESDGPAQAFESVNRDLLACGRFVTACVGLFNPADRTWTYASAGHPGGLILSEGGVRKLDSTGMPLGISAEATWHQRSIRMCSGDRLFLYTDGVADAGAPGKTLGERGLIRVVEATAECSVQEQVQRAIRAVDARSATGAQDDATLVAFEVLPQHAPQTAAPQPVEAKDRQA